MIERVLDAGVAVLGPLAVVLIVMLGFVGYLYRNDQLQYRGTFQRLIEDHVKSQHTLQAAIDRMSQSVDRAEDQRQRNFDLLMRAIDRRT